MIKSVFNVTREDGTTYQYNIKAMRGAPVWSIREKEIVRGYKAMRKSDGQVMIDIRVYTGRSSSASVFYAIVWLHGDIAAHGVGKASGYGYDKRSASIRSALRDLGVASDVREIAESGDISRALRIMYRDIFDEDCFIAEFYA